MIGLLTVGVTTPVSAASPKPPSVLSRETRVALLSIFDQLGMGVDSGNQATRSRANRRHPDVGFISSDPICLSCVLTVLAPPVVSPPAPRPSPPPAVPQASIPSLPVPPPAPKPILPLPAAPKPPASQPLASKPPAPKPLTILQSSLPAVLAPPKAKIAKPLASQPALAASGPGIIAAQAPVQTPGPLPILGLGVAFGVSRRLRGRIKEARCQRVR